MLMYVQPNIVWLCVAIGCLEQFVCSCYSLCAVATVCVQLLQFVCSSCSLCAMLHVDVCAAKYCMAVCSYRMFGAVCVQLLQFVCSCYSLCAAATVCVQLLQFVCSCYSLCAAPAVCVQLLQFVCSCYSLCAVATVCVQLLQFVCSSCSLCAAATVCVQLLQFDVCAAKDCMVVYGSRIFGASATVYLWCCWQARCTASDVCQSSALWIRNSTCFSTPLSHLLLPPLSMLFALLLDFRRKSLQDISDFSFPGVRFLLTDFCWEVSWVMQILFRLEMWQYSQTARG